MASTTTLMALKAQNEARQAEERKMTDRKRAVLVLIMQYLIEMGWVNTAAALSGEAGAQATQVRVRWSILYDPPVGGESL